MTLRDDSDVRCLVYASIPADGRRDADLDRILAQSRRNNGLNGVTGLLAVYDSRYVQVLEGAPGAVGFIMALIARDDRHTDVRILSDRPSADRVFGGWTMADLGRESGDEAVRGRLHHLLRDAPESVRDAFAVFV